jgi:hypothetical protein
MRNLPAYQRSLLTRDNLYLENSTTNQECRHIDFSKKISFVKITASVDTDQPMSFLLLDLGGKIIIAQKK